MDFAMREIVIIVKWGSSIWHDPPDSTRLAFVDMERAIIWLMAKRAFSITGGIRGRNKGKKPLSQNLIYIGRSRRHASRARKCIDPALFYDLIQP